MLGGLSPLVRGLRRAAAYSITGVVLATTGIFAAACGWALLGAMKAKPPFPEPGRLVVSTERLDATAIRSLMDAPPPGIASAAAVEPTRVDVSHGGAEVRSAPGALTVGDLAATLLGRSQQPLARRGAAISAPLAGQLFGTGDAALGSPVKIDARLYYVSRFVAPEVAYPPGTEVWIPGRLTTSGAVWILLARLGPGLSLKQADDEVAGRLRALGFRPSSPTLSVYSRSFAPDVVEAVEAAVLGGLCILALASASLMLLSAARAAQKAPELRWRIALGASMPRLVGGASVEAIAIAALGLLLGGPLSYAFVAFAGSRLGVTAPGSPPVGVLAAAALGTFLLLAAAGAAPPIAAALRSCRGVASEGCARGPLRLGGVLVFCQATVALPLLFAAVLTVMSLARLWTTPTGFARRGVATMYLWAPRTAFPTPARFRAAAATALERIRALPNVLSAGASSGLPFQGYAMTPVEVGEARGNADVTVVSPGYFRTMAIPIERGRDFLPSDGAASTPVCAVSSLFAAHFLAGRDPIGSAVGFATERCRIVAVVGDIRQRGFRYEPKPALYLPFGQFPGLDMAVLVVRAKRGDAALLRAAIARSANSVSSAMTISDFSPIDRVLADAVAPERDASVWMSACAILAVVLAVGGLLGLAVYTTSRRNREMAIRQAVGAGPFRVAALLLSGTLGPGLAGTVTGAAAAVAAARLLSALLYGVRPSIGLLGACAGAFGITAGAAAIAPVWQLVRTPPASLLRHE